MAQRLKSFSAAFPGVGLMQGKLSQNISDTEQIRSLEYDPETQTLVQSTIDLTNIGHKKTPTVINLFNAAWYEVEVDKPH
jgi:hypothetical protein